MSITDELRKYATVSWDPWPEARDRLLQMCDRIDEAHKHAIGYVADYDPETMAENGWYRVLDADEVPVRIGDVMAYADNTKPMKVVALVPPAVFLTEDGPRYADMCRHHHAPTVEDVLFEFAQFWSDEELTDIEHLQPHAAQTIAEYAKRLRLAGGEDK